MRRSVHNCVQYNSMPTLDCMCDSVSTFKRHLNQICLVSLSHPSLPPAPLYLPAPRRYTNASLIDWLIDCCCCCLSFLWISRRTIRSFTLLLLLLFFITQHRTVLIIFSLCFRQSSLLRCCLLEGGVRLLASATSEVWSLSIASVSVYTDRLGLFEYRTNFLWPQDDLAVQVDVFLCEEVNVE